MFPRRKFNDPNRVVCLRLEGLEQRLLLAGDLMISEFQANNRSTIADEDGEFSDWIEIHNVSGEAMDLNGWFLTDDAKDLEKWRFPAVTLPPDGYQLAFASGKDRGLANSELHTNFQLAADGEFLALVRPDGESIESDFGISYPPQLVDLSYGLLSDGTSRLFGIPSPGAANSTDGSFLGVTTEPDFNIDSGFYDAALSVELISPSASAEIRFTLDSSEPTEASTLYVGPLSISSTTIVRAAAFDTGYLTAGDASRSYLYLDDVLQQDGAGLPDTWGTFANNFPLGPYRRGESVPANYEVDPEVANDERYRDTIKDDLQTIPSLSLVFSPDDIWSESTGLYSNTLESGIDWERPVSAELIDTDGSIEFQIDAGARIHGGFSRRPSASAKHSIRLLFKADYGPTKLEYPWFGDDAAAEFDTVVLRASYNFSWSRGERNNNQHGDDGTFVQDRWAAVLQNEMGGLAPSGAWVHLYINGLYWGLYNPNERPSAPFQATYQGGEVEDFDVLKIGEVIDGNATAWNELLSLVRSNPIDYEAVQQKLDVPGFIDYMMINHFGGNEDWPHNNWYASRRRVDDAQWQFHSWDAEFLFRDKNTNRVAETNQNVRSGPGEIYNRLRTVDEFKTAFGDRIQKHFFNDGLLTPAANIARLDSVAAPIDRAIVGESARWGDALFNNINPALTRDDHWLPRLEELRTEYFPVRNDIVLEQYRDVGLYPDVAPPTFSQHGGLFNPGVALSIAAASGTTYYTTDGSDPRSGDGDVASNALPHIQPIVLSGNTVVQARTFDGSEWSALVSATFTQDTSLPMRVTEIMYHPADPEVGATFAEEDFEFIEVMNVSSQPINAVGAAFVDGIEFTFPSMEIAAGERVVVVKNAAAIRSRYGTEVRIAGEFESGKLSNNGELIQLIDGRGDVISSIAYDDTANWPLRADGAGASLEAIDVAMEADVFGSPQNWRGSVEQYGSPGRNGSEPVGVVVNEVLTRTSDTGSTDSIELFNTTQETVDLGGWSLSDSANLLSKFSIPNGTFLGPGKYLVFDESDFVEFSLNGTDGDEVWLTIPSLDGGPLSFVDEVSFGAAELGETWGRYPNGTGQFTPLSRNSLGGQNSFPRVGPVVVSEIQYTPGLPTAAALAISPTLTSDDLQFVEILNPTSETVDLSGWGLRGGVDYRFNSIVVLPPDSSAVVVSFSPELEPSRADAFRAHYGISDAVLLVGGWNGRLNESGEPIELLRLHLEADGSETLHTEDLFYYDEVAPWPNMTEQGSLHRASPVGMSNDGSLWSSQDASPGSVDFSASLRGDFSGDGTVGLTDIDLLFAALHADSDVEGFDLDKSAELDDGDVTLLIENVLNTRRGDTNLDGNVDFADFLRMSANFGSFGTWDKGDFDGDGEVGFADFLILSSQFGFRR